MQPIYVEHGGMRGKSLHTTVHPVAAAKKLLATLDAAKKIPTLTVTAAHIHTDGHNAEEWTRRGGGSRKMRRWQTQRYRALVRALLRRIIAPMGAGKSTLAVAMALYDLNRGLKVIVAYPQRAIAHGFGRKYIELPGGKVHEWVPRKAPDEVESVADIVKFILAPPSADRAGRTVICTHAALVRVFAILKAMGKKDPWKGTALIIDEGHHSQYDEDGQAVRSSTNCLGEIVRHYVQLKSGPLTVATATWLRTEGSIIPKNVVGCFVCDPYPIDEYLESMKYLRDVRIRFVVGPTLEAFRTLIEADPKRKTLVYMPLGLKQLEKQALFAKCNSVLRQNNVEVCDFVTLKGRDVRREHLFARIKEQVTAWDSGASPEHLPKGTPDLVFALNMFREGADWPEASRAILLAPRGSVVDTLQILGRLLRDWPDKKDVEFDIILPAASGGEVDPGKMGDYLKIVFASLIVEWQFKRGQFSPQARTAHAKRAKARLAEPGTMVRIVDGVTQAAIAHDGDEQVYDAVVDEVLIDELIGEHKDVRRYAAQEVKQFFQTAGARRDLYDAKSVPLDPKLVMTPFGLIKTWASMFGWRELRALRVALGKRPALSIEYIRTKVIEHAASKGWKPAS